MEVNAVSIGRQCSRQGSGALRARDWQPIAVHPKIEYFDNGHDICAQCDTHLCAGSKGQKMCAYELCPSPLHSKKWRVVTAGTNAGGRDWNTLVGQTLCDSCYSTFRKHGTFVRSIRTNEGWSRVGEALCLLLPAAVMRCGLA